MAGVRARVRVRARARVRVRARARASTVQGFTDQATVRPRAGLSP